MAHVRKQYFGKDKLVCIFYIISQNEQTCYYLLYLPWKLPASKIIFNTNLKLGRFTFLPLACHAYMYKSTERDIIVLKLFK